MRKERNEWRRCVSEWRRAQRADDGPPRYAESDSASDSVSWLGGDHAALLSRPDLSRACLSWRAALLEADVIKHKALVVRSLDAKADDAVGERTVDLPGGRQLRFSRDEIFSWTDPLFGGPLGLDPTGPLGGRSLPQAYHALAARCDSSAAWAMVNGVLLSGPLATAPGFAQRMERDLVGSSGSQLASY